LSVKDQTEFHQRTSHPHQPHSQFHNRLQLFWSMLYQFYQRYLI
jgi:hypothetical protein